MRRGDKLVKFSILFNILWCVFYNFSNLCLLSLNKQRSVRDPWSHQMSLCPGWLTHKKISDKVHRLFVMLPFFRPFRVVQFRKVIPLLTLLLYFLVSKDLVYTGICEASYQELL